MLQQTQVQTALPYYEKFLKAFPTIEDLAQADQERVVALWSGLGYYSRARNLHEAARIICRRHGGRFPNDFDAALRLPGVGRYTAGAVLSIAYGNPLPVLDGNIRRVLARYLMLEGEKGDTRLWRLLERIVQIPALFESIADFNQALMELGALVCTPRDPDCAGCPLCKSCVARRAGAPESLPAPRRLRKAELREFTAAVIPKDGNYLLRQNFEQPFLKGFWEFPKISGHPRSDAAMQFKKRYGIDLQIERNLPPVRHQITFRKLVFHPLLCRLDGPIPEDWVCQSMERAERPMSSYVVKILRAVEPPA